jgi:DNA-binding Lrp family transcriptional regulator
MFSQEEKTLLMAIQYEFPLTENPFYDLSTNTGLPLEFVIAKVKMFRGSGVIKRIGANLNYKAFRMVSKAALVGASVPENRIEEVSKMINRTRPKHNFWRTHENYNVWFTFKARTEDEVIAQVKELMKTCNVCDYVILPTKRVYKMDVKYDLFKGISWSNKGIEPETIPFVDELGLDSKMLKELENLEVKERPFMQFAENGYSESEIVELIAELIKKGVVRDFSGVLSERRIGINENGMTIIKPEGSAEEVALRLLNDLPQITHLIVRNVPENWEYPVYFMMHASSKSQIEETREKVLGYDNVADVKILYSKMDLKDFGV